MTATGERRVKKRAAGLPKLSSGKKPYPEGKRRELISVRIMPATKAALERVGADNLGRAIDEVIAILSAPLLASTQEDSDSNMAAIGRAARELISENRIPVTRI